MVRFNHAKQTGLITCHGADKRFHSYRILTSIHLTFEAVHLDNQVSTLDFKSFSRPVDSMNLLPNAFESQHMDCLLSGLTC